MSKAVHITEDWGLIGTRPGINEEGYFNGQRSGNRIDNEIVVNITKTTESGFTNLV